MGKLCHSEQATPTKARDVSEGGGDIETSQITRSRVLLQPAALKSRVPRFH